ncbi:DnaJ-related protein SCJ1 [Fulvia fulva]|uniref:DnaJ-related protein SCJ1 n=1 Tax=Passalora fulva TaxID=5499 RepID=A0A9Q8UT23_PASFU|nr:DnaJ-related protein SCJ1 [Fulvia fulva]KAK4613622.1 DnaJ-related protein SCJ1 [Fulvia fulva]KAK4614877.1 DnaJ-related protein SCJ1 [Fulvia fulva]UJO21416.1 DnaJ-related protein SCJ1 [Fulvia fulva]WPV20313.1 DnaJ-related protein SCJ1 [Fulvia fulva]WPV34990.1 DnaJ-related protein SCJ1 [Fulvia fulva]
MLINFSILALACLVLAVAAQDYYKLLEVDRDASERDLKKAYRRLSKKYHPDKNPDDEAAAKKFVEVSEAYETLSDEEMRRVYNQYGAEGVKQRKQQQQGGGGGRNPFDIFNQFFGGGGHFGHGQRRGPNMEVRVAFPLKDFYTGAVHEFKIEKQVVCDSCSGTGAEDDSRHQCEQCGGQGMVIRKQMLAPGIFQQMQMQCDKCGGRGQIIKHKCKKCKGERVVRAEEAFDISVEKGMPRGVRVNYENEGDESPDWQAGDLVVHLTEQEPVLDEKSKTDGTFFRRKDLNLFWREVLSLREAWMGDWTRNLTHLDGHTVQLSRKRGQVIQPGHVDVIEGEGMPAWNWRGDGPEYGALHVEYVVVLPDQMESGMEKDFWATWEKYRKKRVDLHKDTGRPDPVLKHDEL